MMHGTEVRYVRTVRLRAPEAKFVRRGVTLLEDALHTASMPGAADGQVLCIRSLAVGVIRPDQSAASLALAIERQLQHLRARAVHALAPGAVQQPAVYFRDDVEPYVLLALRLARGQPVAGWFWPMVVPTWQPGLSRAEALRRVVFGAIRTQAGVAAAVRIVRVLHEAQVFAPLCAALQPTDGSMLLRACGWTASTTAPQDPMPREVPQDPTPREMPLPAGWTTLIRQWAQRWGAMEPRTLWLAAMGAAIRQPLRLFDPLLMQRVQQMVAQAAKDFDAETPEVNTLPTERAGAGERTGSASKTALREAPQESGTPELEKAAAVQTRSVTPWVPSASATHPPNSSFQHHPELHEERGTPTARQRTMRDDDEPDIAAAQRLVAPSATVVTDSRPSPDALKQSSEYEAEMAYQPHAWPTKSQPTAYAGLFFLIPALERLGMAAFLTSHPHWIERDLPWRLLRNICTALAAPDDDPMLAAMAWAYSPEEAVTAEGFVAPENWRQTGCASPPWRLSRVATHRGRRVLCDASGRLPVAVWSDTAPESVRPLIDGRPIRRAPMHPLQIQRVADLDAVVLGAWHTALRRWCRRHAGVGLATLVHRPGLMMWTPTHIDMVFRHADTDLRVRKAGLDLTLGWVPWLSRVVTFHYVEKEWLDA